MKIQIKLNIHKNLLTETKISEIHNNICFSLIYFSHGEAIIVRKKMFCFIKQEQKI